MARTNIPITSVAELGTAQPSATAGDSANDHYIDGGQDVLIEMKNTSGGTLVATVVTPYATPGGVALADVDVSCTAGQTKYVKLKGGTRSTYYQQSGDSNRIYVDVTSDSWEFRVYAI